VNDLSKYNITFVYDNKPYTASLFQAQESDRLKFSIGNKSYTFEADVTSPKAVVDFFESLANTTITSDKELIEKLASIKVPSVSLTKRTYELATERLLGKETTDSPEAAQMKKNDYLALRACSDEEQVAKVIQSSKCSTMMLFDIADLIEQDNAAIAKIIRTLARPFDLQTTVSLICMQIQENYFDESIGKRCASHIESRLDSYKNIHELDDFTATITRDLREISHDAHFELIIAQTPTTTQKPVQDPNFGFGLVEKAMDGTCSLEIKKLENPSNPLALEKVKTAMQELKEANPKAIILDLRENHGGSPYMTARIASYFLEADIPLTSFRYRHEPQGEEKRTFPTEPTKTLSYDALSKTERLLDVPLYVLTSHETFSAAEDLTCHMKELGRATIIGETSGGGANPAKLFTVGKDFLVAIPIGEAVVPYGKSWEGMGITPQISVTRDADAHEVAKHVAAVERELLPRVPVPGKIEQTMSLEARMQELAVPGVQIAVINRGRLEWSKGYGTLDDTLVEEEKPTQAASIGKTVTAFTVLSLVSKGVFGEKGLDKDVGEILDKDLWESINPKGYPVTLKQLLSHTAGINVGGFLGYENDQKPLPNLDDILLGKGNSPKVEVIFTPGEKYQYSGGGITILQKVIEVATGKSFADVVKEQVFDKLSMGKSGYFLEEKTSTAEGNGLSGKLVEGAIHRYPELAAAGLWTTAGDLAKVAVAIQQSLEGKGIVPKALAIEMTTKQTKENEAPQGLGCFVETFGDVAYFTHQGGNEGFNTLLIANNKGQGTVILTNSSNGQSLYEELLNRITTVYKWEKSENLEICKPKIRLEEITTTDPRVWGEKYAGVYEDFDPTDGKKFSVILWLEDGKIMGQYVPAVENEPDFEVTPVNDKTASFRLFNPGPLYLMRFSEEVNRIELDTPFGTYRRSLPLKQ
jgi:CubicO group peptidase (beta-lactamase class C family)